MNYQVLLDYRKYESRLNLRPDSNILKNKKWDHRISLFLVEGLTYKVKTYCDYYKYASKHDAFEPVALSIVCNPV